MKASFIPSHGKKESWDIIIDGVKWREVHRTIFGAKPIFPTLHDESELQSAFDAYEYRRVKNYVIWRLSKQSYHSEQLAKLLRDRLVQPKTIKQILLESKEKGLLNDEVWLSAFLQSHLKRYGLPYILSKLKAKGLSSETLQKLAYESKNPEQELEAIENLIRTRYKKKDFSQFKEKQKVIAALARKGYHFEQIKAVFSKLYVEM